MNFALVDAWLGFRPERPENLTLGVNVPSAEILTEGVGTAGPAAEGAMRISDHDLAHPRGRLALLRLNQLSALEAYSREPRRP